MDPCLPVRRFFGGDPSAGKSRIARKIARKAGIPVIVIKCGPPTLDMLYGLPLVKRAKKIRRP